MIAKIACVLGLATVSYAAVAADKVTEIPGYGKFDQGFDVYSGYLSGRKDSKGKDLIRLHYVFVESADNPVTDPVVIWFNGGPGCSSMLGFSQEHGPFVNEDGTSTFVRNEWSWNKNANMLYLEMPGGVGFSYCTTEGKKFCDGTTSYTDTQVAVDNLEAFLEWFTLFPEFKTNDLFVSGESYAGVYVPYMVKFMDQHNTDVQKAKSGDFQFNLKGFIVGNGVTNWKWDGDQAYIKGGWPRGLSSYDMHKQIVADKCDFYYYDNDPSWTAECNAIADKFQDNTSSINVYDIYRTCWTVNDTSSAVGFTELNGKTKPYRRHYTARDYTPWIFAEDSTHPFKLKGGDCTWDSAVVDLFNNKEARAAMHIPDDAGVFEECSNTIGYISGHNASYDYYPELKGKYRILHYSGDTDGAVPTEGTMQWMHLLNWKIEKPWRAYYVNDQVAGYYTVREDMDFGTVHGCGHMAPQWKRQQTHHLIFKWITKQEP